VEFPRFIQNVYEHHRDKTFSTQIPIDGMLFDDVVLFDDFPNLVIKSTRLQPLMAGEDKR
jgi:hypothetical protein